LGTAGSRDAKFAANRSAGFAADTPTAKGSEQEQIAEEAFT
jgi:hypothetical protein